MLKQIRFITSFQLCWPMQCVWPITTFLFWQCDKRHTSKGTVKAERRSKYVVIYSLVRLNVSTTGSSSIDIASFFEMFKGHNKTSVPTKRHICQSTCNQENEILTRSTTCPLYTSRCILACWINFKPGACEWSSMSVDDITGYTGYRDNMHVISMLQCVWCV